MPTIASTNDQLLPRMVAIPCILLMIGALLVLPSPPAGSAPGPARGASGATGVVPSSQLEGVSSPSTTFCMAVGLGVEQTTPLAEVWTGGSWTVTPAVSIGSYGSYLSGVSCTGPDWCTAVGAINTSYSDYVPLVGQWDGTFCTAVGWGGRQAFIATWDGTAWSGSTLAVADNTSTLGSVSCSSVSDCLATGWQQPCIPGMGCLTAVPLITTWDGAAWSLPPTPNGNGASVGTVSCPSGTTDCVAAGASNDATSGLTDTVTETWDGSNWSVVPGPTIGPAGGTLAGLSCTAATSCLAVGNSSNVSPTVQAAPVATTWDGSSATLETPADPSATFAELLDTSCTSSTECTTVGVEYGGTVPHTLVETWDAGVAVSTSPYLTAVRWSKGPATAPATALPRGMTLSPAGVLSGTPGAHLAPGPTSVSVRVTEKVNTVTGSRKVRTVTTVIASIPLTVN
jgi:hypothetical protein